MSLNSFEKSKEMFLRATRVIPSGISGHKNPSFGVPGSFPYFAERGEGCRYVDVDGNEYIDFLCGYGPIVLGYNYKKIDAAADAQRALGSAFNHPTPRTVELAEKLVELIPCADWAAFGRNGSDVTTYAIQIAREYTQRRKIIVARGAYHGSHAWCTPGHGGLLIEDQLHVLTFTWNDATELEALVKAHEGDVAGVILTPYHHPAFAVQELPTESFWPDVRRICDSHGIVLICDDIRAGFRLHMRGSGEYFGFVPDMMCYCKAIANGYSLSAIVGKDEFKAAASNVFFTGTYYTAACRARRSAGDHRRTREHERHRPHDEDGRDAEGRAQEARRRPRAPDPDDGPCDAAVHDICQRAQLPSQPVLQRRVCQAGCAPSPPSQLVHDVLP